MIHNRKIDSYTYRCLQEDKNNIFIDTDENTCLKKGDLIVFRTEDESFTHEFITAEYKGVIRKAFMGRMIYVVPLARKIIMPLPISDKSMSRVTIIVLDENNEMLLCRHKDRETWDIPSGNVKKNESSKEAALRKLYEETGACSTDIEELYKVCAYHLYDMNSSSEGTYCDIYIARIKNGNILPALPLESKIAECRLFDIYNEKGEIVIDELCQLTHRDIYAPLICEIVDRTKTYLSNIRMHCDNKYFMASMLFPRKENEKYAVRLRYENGDVCFHFPKIFKSYYELFEYINRTEVREELNIDKHKNDIWEICRFHNDKAVARWCLSMYSELLCANFYGDDSEEYGNFNFGQVYLDPNNINTFYIYLSEVTGNKHSFFRVFIDENGECEFDVEYTCTEKEFICMQKVRDNIPEMVSRISDKFIGDPHDYYVLKFNSNSNSFSRCEEKEKHKIMKKFILQSW